MIKSFRDAETEKIFNLVYSKAFSRDIQDTGYRKLAYLNSAITVHDLTQPPGNRLEKLTGNRVGQYSIRVNDKYRICFEWQNGDAYNVEIVDYH